MAVLLSTTVWAAGMPWVPASEVNVTVWLSPDLAAGSRDFAAAWSESSPDSGLGVASWDGPESDCGVEVVDDGAGSAGREADGVGSGDEGVSEGDKVEPLPGFRV